MQFGFVGMNDMSIRTIDECFYQIRNGANIKQGTVEGGYPITRIETTANDRFNRDRMGYAGITDIEKYESYILQDGDLLMSHINSVQYLGRTVLYEKQGNEKIIHGMNLLGLKARRDIIIPAYARYCFYSYSFRQQIGRITKKSVNQASFAVADLKKIKIKVPDLFEQSRVVDILNRLNQVIEDRQQELQKLADLTKARFVEMFGDAVSNPMGWTVKKLKDLTVQINSGNTPKGGSENYVNEGIIFFRSQNVWKDRLEMDDIAYIDAETHASMKRSSLKHGDILMTKTGRINTENSSLGRAALYMGEDDKANVNGHVYFIRLKPEVNNKFILRILVSDEYRDLIRSVCVGGIDKRQLNKEHIEEFPIICPPSDMIDKYVAFAEQVNKSKVEVQKALDETQKLFDSLMQQYFG